MLRLVFSHRELPDDFSLAQQIFHWPKIQSPFIILVMYPIMKHIGCFKADVHHVRGQKAEQTLLSPSLSLLEIRDI